MPRPKPDAEKIRARLIAEAEAQLEQTDGRRLVLSELAQRVGMSQSHVHTFFPTKADLVRSLAAKWFHEVEEASGKVVRSDAEVGAKLEAWILSILRIKRDRFDANPRLFRAYLELAGEHMDLVQAHVLALHRDLTLIVQDMVPGRDPKHAVQLVENATLLFRTPQNIAAYRDRATDAAASEVCRMLRDRLAALES